MKAFASDNYAGAHPEILQAIAEANTGHEGSYGADSYTERLQSLTRNLFGESAVAYPVLTGTGANVVGLQAMQSRWGAVICAASAHINTDENGAPERVGGMKLLPVSAPDGKLTPELIDHEAWGFGEEHRAQPEVVSISQVSELGTVYSVNELRAISDHCKHLGLKLHMDGARIANAAASLGKSFAELTSDIGVDVLSFGGTKNGLLFGELIVAMTPNVVDGVGYLRKIAMQNLSKSRYISAQFLALYGTPLGLESATHANNMAQRLRSALEVDEIPGLEFTQPTQANTIFARLPPGVADRIRQHYGFYDWDAQGQVRWMCSFDTTEAEVDDFAAAIIQKLKDKLKN
ncbi:MAG: low specificity L-threonine aldolase [Microbacteriaceae bacterium]